MIEPDINIARIIACCMPVIIAWLVGGASSRRIGEATGAVALFVLALVAGWA